MSIMGKSFVFTRQIFLTLNFSTVSLVGRRLMLATQRWNRKSSLFQHRPDVCDATLAPVSYCEPDLVCTPVVTCQPDYLNVKFSLLSSSPSPLLPLHFLLPRCIHAGHTVSGVHSLLLHSVLDVWFRRAQWSVCTMPHHWSSVWPICHRCMQVCEYLTMFS